MHARVEHRPAPAPLDEAGARESLAPHVEDRQVVVEPHPRQRHPAPAGRHHRVGNEADRLRQRHALARARSVEIPCTAVASAGISQPGSMRPDQLRTTTPSTTDTSA